MAATFTWKVDNGSGPASTGTATDNNWKNIDDNTTVYSSAPITAGNNSFERWTYGSFSGTFNQILSGLFAHTATAFGSGLSLVGTPAGSSQLTYTTPSTTANSNLTTNMTTAISIGSGVAVYFGPTSANTASKATSSTSNPTYSNYLTTQLQTTSGAAAGDTAQVTLTLQYQEN